MADLELRLKHKARELGFDLVGIAPVSEAETHGFFLEWLARGYAGDMAYLQRHSEARRHPRHVLESVRGLVMLGMNYKPAIAEGPLPPLAGKVARYARGPDYHDILWRRLDQLLAWFQEQAPGSAGRGVVDTAPLLERDFARRAGLGWFGKNTMLLSKTWGSYFVLGALLVDRPLEPDPAHATAHCGTCTACLDACPTQAFVGPGQLDATRCLSYWNIETAGTVPLELRSGFGDWLFGCDICQEVCPWNRKAPATREPAFVGPEAQGWLELTELLTLTEADFRRRFRGTPLWRARRAGLLRSACLVLGNQFDPSALPALRRAAGDADTVIREAALWAIEQIEKGDGSIYSASASGA